MPRRLRKEDDGFDGPDDPGIRDGWESEAAPCPECGADVYEDADRCPKCGRYISRSERAEGVPLVFKIAAVLLVLGMLAGIVTM